MSKIIFTRGIQGSGKSTWAKQYCQDNQDWVRVSRDDLRNMRGKYWIPKDEGMISEMEIDCAYNALDSGKNVIIDAMNLNRKRDIDDKLTQLELMLFGLGDEEVPVLDYEIKNFTDVPLEECQRRNLIRPNSIDPKIIQGTWEKYLAPELVVYEEDKSLPHCVIFDVDGTLAKMDGRSPYDWHRVGEDKVNEPIRNLYHAMHLDGETKLIIFTGRDGSCLDATTDWLRDNGIHDFEIYIRPEGDTRKDSIVKRELFENNIRGKYYVDFVVDDRDQVVDMWRKELGLTCLQVDYGNF